MTRLAAYLLTASALVLVACVPPDDLDQERSDMTTPILLNSPETRLVPAVDPPPLERFPGRLAEGAGPEDPHVRPPLAETRALSEQQVEQLLQRLEPLVVEPEDEVEFALRPGSLPPPRTGATLRAEFPAPEERSPPDVEPAAGPLRVLRFGPEGSVPLAGQVSVTFDRPMVAVTAHDDLAEVAVPANLSPNVPGNWRWVGARTLLFEPEAARLPMATQYTVTLDPEVRAADGRALADPVEWAFATPPVGVVNSYPSGTGVPLEPVIVLVFDQRVQLDSLASSLAIVDRQGRNLAYRAATDEEIEADDGAASLVEQLEPGRWVALRTEQPLPPGSGIELVLEAGAASAEGLLLTTEAQRREFSTYGTFVVSSKSCGWRMECSPGDPLLFQFSNDLDEEQDIASLISVDPPIEGMDVDASGRSISIAGLKRGQTTYQIEFDPRLADRFGQPLSGSRSFSFEVGSFRPSVGLGTDTLTTLDPMTEPTLEFYSTNYQSAQVHIHRVQPGDWLDYLALYRGQHQWRESLPEFPGEEVFSGVVPIEPRRDELVRTPIDLSPWLDSAKGHLLVMVGPGELLDRVPEDRWSRNQITWVQATSIGIDAAVDDRNMLVWATRLADGAPLEGVEVRLGALDDSWSTDMEGLASIELPSSSEVSGRANWLEVRDGADTALLPESPHWATRTGWRNRSEPDDVIWYVFDDRQMYRPGETVHLKGWLRRMEKRPDGGLGLLDQPLELRYTVTDARGNSLHEGTAEVVGLGGFELSFDLPDTPNLGNAAVQFNLVRATGLGQTRHTHQFSIQEFRTPEFEVRTRVGVGPFIGAEPIAVEVEAAYYAGGALPGADVRWDVRAEQGHYAPPGHDQWSFGFQPPWWMPWQWRERNGSASRQLEGRTDGAGRHGLEINLDFTDQPRPLLINAASTVMDVNRQAWSSSSEILAHPGEVYVGLRSETQFVDRNEPLVIDLLTVDIDGEAVGDRPVVVEAARIRHMWGVGRSDRVTEETQRCEVTTAADGIAQCRFETAVGGQYEIMATTMDELGRHNATRIVRWVGGGRMPRIDRVEIEEVLLIPDREQHAPGETARLLVQAPFDNAEGLLTLRRHGLAEQRRFTIEDGSATLEIPLRHDWIPNIQAHVTLVGSGPRGNDEQNSDLPPRPAIAVGSHDFTISTAERSLDVRVEPAASGLAPGEETEVELAVVDADGQPVANAEVALVVVDEAVLALSDYRISSPLETFYFPRPPAVRDHHLRPTIRLMRTPDLSEALAKHEEAAELMMDQAAVTGARMAPAPATPPGAEAEPIDVREDFNPLAAFIPALITDAEGRARTTVKLPDNLTRYRITALAVSGSERYGLGEASLTARLPLMVRPSPPRFLNFGDTFEFPVVLQNQTDHTLPVQIAIDLANLEATGARGFALEVPANDRVEVRFPASARLAGTARYQLAVAADNFADAARGQLPVWTPATTEAFATYGTLDDGAMVQPVVKPARVWPQFGQLEITTTSTAVQSLADAFLYLHDYPYSGSEQIASRIIATAALRDVLHAFEVADMPSLEEIADSMARDLDRLAGLQNPDGGFGLWLRGRESWPYATLHVAHALVRAREKGYPVEAGLFDRTLAHVRDIEQHIPSNYHDWTRRHIVAYSLYVRALAGDADRSRARQLMDEVDDLAELSFESIGWLLGVLTGAEDSAELRELRRFLANRVVETAASANFISGWRDGAHLVMQSQRSADGIILEALIDDQPESDLIVRLVNGLQAHRTRGRWGNTQENAFVLLALDKYFQRYEDIEPDFVARTWLGEDFAGEHHFHGRTTERHHTEVPMQWLARDDGEHQLILQHDGEGRMYYRVGLAYAPLSLELEPASHGFEVQRVYRGVDDDDDVRLRSDGVWEIRAGARVEVELTLVASARRYHVALVDPLPAGLESINPALAVSDPIGENGGVQPMPQARAAWWGPWYQHQNLRDERTEAFTTLLDGGVYEYAYFARATTPGEFVVPPARAEELYHPETFGRSATARVVVVE